MCVLHEYVKTLTKIKFAPKGHLLYKVLSMNAWKQQVRKICTEKNSVVQSFILITCYYHVRY